MYDLGIIGAGPAGYVAAERAGHNGLNTVLFEARELGGVCLNEGCMPTKTLLNSAKIADHARESGKFGVNAGAISVDFAKVMERKEKVVKTLVSGIASKMKKNKVTVVRGHAEISGKAQDHFIVLSGKENYQCKNLLIATGAEAAVPPIKGLQREKILTNREILCLKTPPKTLAIVGGGVIGLEFASFFNSIGSKVVIIEMMNEILPGIDREIAAMLRKEYEKKGIEFHLDAKVNEIKNKTLVVAKGGDTLEITGDEILISTGRKPNIAGFGLEKLGVTVERGGVVIDRKCRTNVPNVYAAGDITGFSLLAHTASREGEVAVNTILGKNDTMRYSAIPGVVYTNPEVACVGLTEEEAKKNNIPYRTGKLPMTYAGRYIAENEGGQSICKVLLGTKYNEILGVHMMGSHCSEMIFGACQMIETQMRKQDVEELVFPHPTVSEIIRETLFSIK